MVSIERSTAVTSKDESSEHKTTVSNIGLDIMNEDLEGHHDQH